MQKVSPPAIVLVILPKLAVMLKKPTLSILAIIIYSPARRVVIAVNLKKPMD
jgi:hypothetical protein